MISLRLRLHWFALAALLVLGFSLGAEAKPTAPATSIRAVLDAQAAAWNRGDVDGYIDGYARSNSTEFVAGDTLTRGWQTVRERYKKKYDSPAKMGRLTFAEVTIALLSDDAALVTGRWKLTREGDRPHGRFTLLFRRTTSGWRIVHDHTSAAPT